MENISDKLCTNVNWNGCNLSGSNLLSELGLRPSGSELDLAVVPEHDTAEPVIGRELADFLEEIWRTHGQWAS